MEVDTGAVQRVSPSQDELLKPYVKISKEEPAMRRVICRYGPGCTHIMDAIHREKFFHARVQKLNDEQIKSHFICNECGYATNSLPDLQFHLKRKTAWSNNSLVGCRINCLVDFKEWHEGYVSQYHKSGKHLVEFRLANEKRWLVMKKIAFYIVERPTEHQQDGSEFKESAEGDNAPHLEDSWVFCEDITIDYAFAQSVLYKIYGNSLQETGHLTRGHVCLTESDRVNAVQSKSSLLYGELLPRGVNKALGAKRLEAFRAESVFDLGMGTGKILVQAFLQFRNLRYIFGVELSAGRYLLAEEAALKMVQLLGHENYHVEMNPGKFIIITEVVKAVSSPAATYCTPSSVAAATAAASSQSAGSSSPGAPTGDGGDYVERVLHLQCGNMFDITNIEQADIVMMETDIPTELYPQLAQLLGHLKEDARVLTYIDLRRAFDAVANAGGPGLVTAVHSHSMPFRQLEINRQLSDRYPTSWSVQRGHHFYLWSRLPVVEPITTSSWGFGSLVHDASSSVPGTSSLLPHHHRSRDVGEISVTDDEAHQRHMLLQQQLQQQHHSQTTTSTSGSRCLPFGMRYFFGGGGSSTSSNAQGNSSNVNSRKKMSADAAQHVVVGSSPDGSPMGKRNGQGVAGAAPSTDSDHHQRGEVSPTRQYKGIAVAEANNLVHPDQVNASADASGGSQGHPASPPLHLQFPQAVTNADSALEDGSPGNHVASKGQKNKKSAAGKTPSDSQSSVITVGMPAITTSAPGETSPLKNAGVVDNNNLSSSKSSRRQQSSSSSPSKKSKQVGSDGQTPASSGLETVASSSSSPNRQAAKTSASNESPRGQKHRGGSKQRNSPSPPPLAPSSQKSPRAPRQTSTADNSGEIDVSTLPQQVTQMRSTCDMEFSPDIRTKLRASPMLGDLATNSANSSARSALQSGSENNKNGSISSSGTNSHQSSGGHNHTVVADVAADELRYEGVVLPLKDLPHQQQKPSSSGSKRMHPPTPSAPPEQVAESPQTVSAEMLHHHQTRLQPVLLPQHQQQHQQQPSQMQSLGTSSDRYPDAFPDHSSSTVRARGHHPDKNAAAGCVIS